MRVPEDDQGCEPAGHPDITAILGELTAVGAELGPVVAEPDNAEYGAARSRVNGSTVRWRVGKLTPTKVGLFVTAWRRSVSGETEPYPVEVGEGHVDTLVVAVREFEEFGAFVFPSSALAKHGISSVAGAGGKRGFRVYPPWSSTAAGQATRTQRWQCEFFVDLAEGVDPGRAILARIERYR